MSRGRTMIRWCTTVAAGLALTHGCATMRSEMGEGERLYRANCASCHRLIAPHEHDRPTWRHYVDEYGQNLDGGQKRLVMDHLAGAD